jgi:hypothetical protein
MKKSLTVVALLAGATFAYSQGQVFFSDYAVGATTGFNIHIWSPNPAAPSVEQTGNSSVAFAFTALGGDAPTGHMNSYGGQALGGNGSSATSATLNYNLGNDFTTELYAAAGTLTTFSTGTFSAIPSTLNPISTASGAAGLMSTAGLNVTFGGTSGSAGAPSAAPGNPVTMAIAAWFNGGGTITSLAAAQALPGTPWGVSPVGTELVSGAPSTPPNLPGLGDTSTTSGGITSFSLVSTPEPSTVALGIIGASAFLMRLRRKQ